MSNLYPSIIYLFLLSAADEVGETVFNKRLS